MAKKTSKPAKAITNSGDSSNQRLFTTSQADQSLLSFLDGFNHDLSEKEAYGGVIQVRSAVTAVANNVAKAKVRIFTKDGREVIGGKLWSLINRPNLHITTHNLVREIVSWLLIQGEYGIKTALDAGGDPVSLTPLDPTKLRYVNPTIPRHLGDVKQWQYNWNGGASETLNANEVIFDATFNPKDTVRGLSPLMAGVNEFNSLYQAGRYVKQFFGNNGVPSNVITLFGVSDEEKKRFKREYEENFSGINGKAWKSLVVRSSTKDNTKPVSVEQLSPQIDFTKFTDLMKNMAQGVFTLYQVPPIISGDWANAKYDSASEQLQTFFDNTIAPILDGLSDTFQLQLVDRFDWKSDAVLNSKPFKLGKQVTNSLDLAISTRLASDLYILFDPSTMPMYARLQRSQIGAIADLREKALMSVNEAAEWLGLEIPDDPTGIRSQKWVKTGLENLDARAEKEKKEGTQPTPTLTPAPAPAEVVDPEEEPVPAVENSKSPETKALAAKFSRVVNNLRTYALKQAESGKPMLLREMDVLAGDHLPALKGLVRHLHHGVVAVKGTEDRAGALRQIFNSVKRRDLVELASRQR